MFRFFDKYVRGRSLWLLTIPMIIVILQWAFLSTTIGELEQEKFSEKCVEIEKGLNRLANLTQKQLDTDNDWDTYDYEAVLADTIAVYDAEMMTFACVYRESTQDEIAHFSLNTDGVLVNENGSFVEQAANGIWYTLISERTLSLENTPFDPLMYDKFMTEINQKNIDDAPIDRGRSILYFEEANPPRDMYTYYRKFPRPESVDRPYLLVVAVSTYSIDITTAEWISRGIVWFGVMTFAINLILIGYIIHIIDRRREVCETT